MNNIALDNASLSKDELLKNTIDIGSKLDKLLHDNMNELKEIRDIIRNNNFN